MSTKRKKSVAASGSKTRSTQKISKGKGIESSSSNSHGIIFKDQLQRMRYDQLVKRKLGPTRYIDEQTLEFFGFLDDVHYMLDNVGMRHFVAMKHPGYERITLEFLSYVSANIIRGKGDEYVKIKFRLNNEDHILTLETFNDIFGLPKGGELKPIRDFSAHSFWYDITRQLDYDASNAKASSIQNPCFRYVHRIIAHTIFGRGDSASTVRRPELFIFWSMLNGCNVDIGSYLARHFEKVGKAGAGELVLGGLITPIAHYFNIDLSADKKIHGNSRFDIESLLKMKVVVKHGDSYCLNVLGNPDPHSLLDPERTTVRNRNNWTFHTAGPPPAALPIEPPDRQHSNVDDLHVALHELKIQQQVFMAQVQMENKEIREMIQHSIEQHEESQAMIQAIYHWHLSQNHFPPP
ncbi:hypothetical protein SESBI_34384 [Sesbania bispinosa]|nr:hypothetical protein SESBI_34384 [Sesbania bispinosa]